MNDVTGPAAAPAAEEPRVRLYVGTSENSLPFFLDGATETQYLTARQRVRGTAERFAGAGNVSNEQIDELMNINPVIQSRAHEVSPMFYTSRQELVATEYAANLSTKGGGEFTNHVRALMRLPFVKEDVRPVLLTLDVPQSAIAHDNEYETLVRKDGGVKIASVVIGAKRGGSGDYVLYDQPTFSPEEALAQLRPASRAPVAAPPADPRQQEILRTIDTFSRDPGVRIVNQGGYTAEATVKDASGLERTVHVPDIKFQPEAKRLFSGTGLRPLAADYTPPHDLTPIEIKAYLDVLDVREQNRRLAPTAKAEALGALLDDYTAANPQLKALEVDRKDAAQLTRVMRGVANGYAPADLQFDLAGRKDSAYDALREKTVRNLETSVSLAPQTLQNIDDQAAHMPPHMARRFAEVQASWAAVTPKPAPSLPSTPEPDTYGRDAPAPPQGGPPPEPTLRGGEPPSPTALEGGAEGLSRVSRIARVAGPAIPAVTGALINGMKAAADGKSTGQVLEATGAGAVDGAFGITDAKTALDSHQRPLDRWLAGGRTATASTATVAGVASFTPAAPVAIPVAVASGVANLGLGLVQDVAYWTGLANNPGTLTQIGSALVHLENAVAEGDRDMAAKNGRLIDATNKGTLADDYQKALTSGNRQTAETARAEYEQHLVNLMIHGKIPKETYEQVDKLARQAFDQAEKNGFKTSDPPTPAAGPATPAAARPSAPPRPPATPR